MVIESSDSGQRPALNSSRASRGPSWSCEHEQVPKFLNFSTCEKGMINRI